MRKDPLRAIIEITLILAVGAAFAWAGSQGGVEVGGWPVFALCAALSFGLNAVLFIPAYVFRTERYFDISGSCTYLLLLGSGLYLSDRFAPRDLLLAGMVAFWAVRLGSFLFGRVTRDGSDGRFDQIKVRFGRFLMAWVLQGLWVLFAVSCALAAITSARPAPIGAVAVVGALIWLLGIGIEITADSQKSRFRSDPENQGRFITTGLWSWSQHPNYFGEVLLWTGVAVAALPAISGWQYATLISPVLSYVLLRRISGVPLLDVRAERRWGDDPDYRRYVRNTPVFVPRPPKRSP